MAQYPKRYGIFKIENGILYGYIEYSFSMGFSSERVRQWDYKGCAFNFNMVKKQHPNDHIFIAKITSVYPKVLQDKTGKKVRIHWKERSDKILSPTYTTKFDRRNVPFTIEES